MRIGCDRGQGELVGQRPVAPQRDQIEVVIPREVEVRVPVGLAGAACRNRARLVSRYERRGSGIRKAAREGTDQLCGRTFGRSEEHTSELQSLMRISSAVFCLKKNKR